LVEDFYSSIKAEQRSENHKTCTKIDQKSNETPTFDVSEESLKHFNTDYYSAVVCCCCVDFDYSQSL
jgi:hypothetical protein